jgi:hypothetical protein
MDGSMNIIRALEIIDIDVRAEERIEDLTQPGFLSPEVHIECAIRYVLSRKPSSGEWVEWAHRWLSGKDRTAASALWASKWAAAWDGWDECEAARAAACDREDAAGILAAEMMRVKRTLKGELYSIDSEFRKPTLDALDAWICDLTNKLNEAQSIRTG